MFDYSVLLEQSPFGVCQADKEKVLTAYLKSLGEHHDSHCEPYSNMMRAMKFRPEEVKCLADIPFFPVRLFKELKMSSVSDDGVFKVMTSSGTTGQQVSKIYLDKNTAANQQKTLVKIVNDFTGGGRLPMLIIDSPSVLKNRAMFSARGAGILGFSIFGRKKVYALDEEMNLNVQGIKDFLEENKGSRLLLFGFTFMVWQYFYKKLKELDESFDFKNAVLIHGGGWKKLADEAVSSEVFRKELNAVCGIRDVFNYYGMVEQTGSVYMECREGHLHASSYSDIIVRRAKDFSECNVGERGIIQVLSALPESYPGHSLLTEDEGMILGVDDCPCGRKGKYFKVLGRIKNAELRGCSDTYAAEHS